MALALFWGALSSAVSARGSYELPTCTGPHDFKGRDARLALRHLAADLGLHPIFESQLAAVVPNDVSGLTARVAFNRIVQACGWTSRQAMDLIVITVRRPEKTRRRSTLFPRCGLPVPLEHADAEYVARVLKSGWPKGGIVAQKDQNFVVLYTAPARDLIAVKLVIQTIEVRHAYSRPARFELTLEHANPRDVVASAPAVFAPVTVAISGQRVVLTADRSSDVIDARDFLEEVDKDPTWLAPRR